MKFNVKEILIPIVVLTLIAAVMAGLLGGTNLLTKDKIDFLAAENEKAAITILRNGKSISHNKII